MVLAGSGHASNRALGPLFRALPRALDPSLHGRLGRRVFADRAISAAPSNPCRVLPESPKLGWCRSHQRPEGDPHRPRGRLPRVLGVRCLSAPRHLPIGKRDRRRGEPLGVPPHRPHHCARVFRSGLERCDVAPYGQGHGLHGVRGPIGARGSGLARGLRSPLGSSSLSCWGLPSRPAITKPF